MLDMVSLCLSWRMSKCGCIVLGGGLIWMCFLGLECPDTLYRGRLNLNFNSLYPIILLFICA